jgi:Rrf2 family transcriptional regulator, nitric oxide-sensitive transcriptional repressor
VARNSQFEAVGNAVRSLEEMRCRCRRADLWRGLGKNLEPAIKMRCIDRQGQMGRHRLAMIAAAHQCDGRPKGAYARDMIFPIGDLALKDGADEGIKPGTAVEGADQSLDHRFADSCAGDDLLDNQIAAGAPALRIHTRLALLGDVVVSPTCRRWRPRRLRTMRLTLWTDYALRTLIYVGTKGERLSTIAEIAESFGVSKTHLMKVVNKLGQQGYIDTVRGKGGGIRLRRPPPEIRVGAVVREMEEDLAVIGCLAESGFCRIEGCCVLRQALRQATVAFLRTLDGYTLADLLVPGPVLVRSLGLPVAVGRAE